MKNTMKKMRLLIAMLCMVCFLFTACKNETDINYSEESKVSEITTVYVEQTTENKEDESYSSGSILFSTEYEVFDYVEDAIIVSKNDGLLYGVLDNKGNEIIPIKYDNIIFLNKDDYIAGCCDIYFLGLYENTKTVLNSEGAEIYTSVNSINYSKCVFEINNRPFFIETTENEHKYYTEDFSYIGAVDVLGWHSITSQHNALSAECCIIGGVDGVYFYDFNGNLINKLPDYYIEAKEKMGDYYVLYIATRDGKKGKILYVDISGSIVKEEDFDVAEEAKEAFYSLKQENGIIKYNLYQSNSTWKLEDLNGDALYDDRYYLRVHPDGEYDCVLLTNEDNYVTVIGRNGNRYIGSGVLEYQDQNIYLLEFNNKQKILGLYEGKNSIIITVNTANRTTLYYYN